MFVQTVSTDSEHIDYEYKQDGSGDYHVRAEETVEYWPVIGKEQPKKPNIFKLLPVPVAQKLKVSLREIYTALENELSILTAIGVRTTFDIACDALSIDPNLTFQEKTDALVKQGHIDARDKERLDTMIDAGSAAAHRGWIPDPPHLITMVEELEQFLHVAFINPSERERLNQEAAAIKAVVPKKKKRQPKPPKQSA